VIAVTAIILASLSLGIVAGFIVASLLGRGPVIKAIAGAVSQYEVRQRDERVRKSRLHRPRERLRSGAMTDEDERTIEEQEQQRREAEREAKIQAAKVVWSQHGWTEE
jgi:hypothetical protein